MKDEYPEDKINVIVNSILEEFSNKKIEREIGIAALLQIVTLFVAASCTKEDIKTFVSVFHKEILATKAKLDSEDQEE